MSSSKGVKSGKVALGSNNLRSFSTAFKKAKVAELSKGLLSVGQFCKLYEVSRTSVYKWIHLYSATPVGIKTVVQMDSEQARTAHLLKQVADLERCVGQKQLQIDYLDKLLEVMSAELGIDLKKKAAQLPLSALEQGRQA